MSRVNLSVCALCVWSALGCAGADHAPAMLPPTDLASTAAASAMPPGLVATLQIDPVTLTASLTPERTGTTQPPQALRFDLDIAQFLQPENLQIVGVSLNDFADVVVRFRQKHPIAAPDLSAPISAKNRADLSYTGRLFILAESTQQNLPGGVRLDPWLVREPDGYASPGNLLADKSGLANNVFPYTLLVDEAKNNREKIGNGGQPTGNYDAATGGWQRDNLGAKGTGWTGFDYLHAGQSCLNEFTLRRANLAANNWTVRLAVVIQYTDPRGVGDMEHRFPVDPVDVEAFAYRLPFAALDVSRLTGCWDHVLLPGEDVFVPITVSVRDWDTNAVEAGDADLSDEPEVSTVQPGASALPEVRLNLPDLYPTPVVFTPTGGTGLPGDELTYTYNIENYSESAPPGDVWGVLTATDPEQGATNRGDYHFGVDPATLAADPARRLAARAYLPIHFYKHGFNTRTWSLSWGDVYDETTGPVVMDAVGNIYAASGATRTANDVEPGDCRVQLPWHGARDIGLSKFDPDGNRVWTLTAGGAGDDYITDLLIDSAYDIVMRCWVTSPGTDLDPGPGEFLVGRTNGSEVVVKWTADGEFVGGNEWAETNPPMNADQNITWQMALGRDDDIFLAGQFKGMRDFDPGPGEAFMSSTIGVGSDAFVLKVSPTGVFQWARTWGVGGFYDDVMFGITDVINVGPAVAGVLVAQLNTGQPPMDLDPTAGTDLQPVSGSGSPVIVQLNQQGEFVFGKTWLNQIGPEGFGRLEHLVSTGQGDLIASGYFQGEGDFDPGPLDRLYMTPGATDEPFLVSFAKTGDFQWAHVYTGLDSVPHQNHLWLGSEDLFFAGTFSGAADFDPSPSGETQVMAPVAGAQYFSHLSPSGFLYSARAWNPATVYHANTYVTTDFGQLLIGGHATAGNDLDLGAGVQAMRAVGGTDALLLNVGFDADW